MRYLPVLMLVFSLIAFAAYMIPVPDATQDFVQILLVGFVAAGCVMLAVGLAGYVV